ncbi:hypothetical protein [Streptomyces sp. TRM49041]|uniref:hypothetical protein n=1 Tax=Streptomyces sp. TRM49041 TaxID=2603216 RepID=UPI0021CC8A1F|nr:hypothetical protein [Streptomyces sp. TRM49041]
MSAFGEPDPERARGAEAVAQGGGEVVTVLVADDRLLPGETVATAGLVLLVVGLERLGRARPAPLAVAQLLCGVLGAAPAGLLFGGDRPSRTSQPSH